MEAEESLVEFPPCWSVETVSDNRSEMFCVLYGHKISETVEGGDVVVEKLRDTPVRKDVGFVEGYHDITVGADRRHYQVITIKQLRQHGVYLVGDPVVTSS